MNVSFLKFLLGSGFCLLAMSSIGQSKILPGIISDKNSPQGISLATVRNIMSGKTTTTSQSGSFSIEVNKGNILAFSSNGYYTDTLTISDSILNLGTLTIQLKPLPATLEDVTVVGNNSYNHYQMDSLARRRDFLALVGENKIPVVGHTNDLGFGVALNLDHFSKHEKKKREARSLFDILEDDAYVNYRWNETIVGRYTSFKGERLLAFMQDNRPDYAWLRKHPTDEDIVYYINARLKKEKE